MKPKVAVILPVYNVMPYLKPMIEALYSSTKVPFKLIIIDGFSTDGTIEYCNQLMKKYENVEIHQIPKKGLVNAINYGIKQAGDFDVYLTQADVIHFKLYKRDWLYEFYKHSKEKDAGFVIGGGGGGISGETFLDGLVWAGTWNTYIPRKTINKIGLFDEQFSGGDDIDYSYRANKVGLKVVICDMWVQHHQWTERNKTHDPDHLIKMGKLFKRKHNL